MTLNIPLFAFGTIISGFLALMLSSDAISRSLHTDFWGHLSKALLLVEAARDIIAIAVIYCMCLLGDVTLASYLICT